MAIDIETPREMLKSQKTLKSGKIKVVQTKGAPRITCVGFSFEDHFSFTIPTLDWYWAHQGVALEDVWDLIRRLCALPCEKAGQNFFFDSWWLRQPEYAVPVRNYRWDTRWMHHCEDPLDDHNLAYQASTATREPYWKDDHKGTDDPENDPTDIDTYWRYNGKDCCVTRELVDTRAAHLEKLGMLKFYDRHYRQMFAPMIDMMLAGTRMEDRKRVFKHARLLADCVGIQSKLTEIAGEELHGPKGDFSSKKLGRFLYEQLRLPRQVVQGKLTANEVAVRKLVLRVPGFQETGGLILDHRRKYKLASFIKDGVADADGRVRSSFGWVDTLRFSSGKNPRRQGANRQNTDREILDLFLPDENCIFLEVDESQGEDRIVKCLAAAATRDPKRQAHLLERARSNPWENDEHRRAASIIYNIPESDVTESPNGGQRYIGKRTRHAGNYDMHGRRLADELLKEGLVYTGDECEGYIQRVIDKDVPEIRLWQREVRQTVLRDRAMASSWGYVLDYTYERLSDDLYRSAYAFIPQHELAMILNEWGFKPLYYWLKTQGNPATINNQKHDSLLISTPPEWAWTIACFLKESLERPRTYAGFELTIPVEFKLGRTEKGDIAFKKFPTQDEFEAAAFSLAT